MGKLKLEAENIYESISSNAPVVVPGKINQPVQPPRNNDGNPTTNDLLNPVKQEQRTKSLFMRVKPSVYQKFYGFCKQKGVSQADMFEYWVEQLLK